MQLIRLRWKDNDMYVGTDRLMMTDRSAALIVACDHVSEMEWKVGAQLYTFNENFLLNVLWNFSFKRILKHCILFACTQAERNDLFMVEN